MAKTRKKHWLFLGILFFLLYFFIAAQPIPKETVLVPRWLTSLESGYPVNLGGQSTDTAAVPFRLGDRFGYFNDNGQFLLNRLRNGNISYSAWCWAEYEEIPLEIDVYDPAGQQLAVIDDPCGYPFFNEDHFYILGSEQNSVSSLDNRGNVLWSYDFPAPLTCIDSAAGLVFAGALDGSLDLLDASGSQIFSFEPGGSRLAVILGCAVSSDGSKLAVISGIDQQRFLLMEKAGDSYRVAYHQFLGTGFRRAVHIAFMDNDNKVIYERENGIGIYDIVSRTNFTADLEGKISSFGCANQYLFVITSEAGNRKRFYCIKMPGAIILDAPFKSEAAFLECRNSGIYAGGDKSIISFEMVKK